MTHDHPTDAWLCRFQPEVRDENPGREFEVVGLRRDGSGEEVLGWTDNSDGGSLAEGARLWPRYKAVEVRRAPQPDLDVVGVVVEGEG